MVRSGLRLSLLSLAIVGCRAEPAEPARVAEPKPAVAERRPPTPTGTVAGELRASGEPLAHAQVCVDQVVPHLEFARENSEPICLRTSSDGRFELELDAGVYIVIANAEQHLPASEEVVLRSGEPGAFVELELVPGGREYSGRVVDLDRKPIAHATVSHVIELDVRKHRAVEVETDEHGRYRLWSSRFGELRVTAPGYARRTVPEHDEQQHVLLPESAISGVVVDRDGQPVANARVVTGAGDFRTWVWGWPDDAVRTDAEGRFTLAPLDPATHEIVAISPERPLIGDEFVHVALAQRRDNVVLTLDTKLHHYTAQVVDALSNAPVGGCKVEWKVGDEPSEVVWADEQGRLEILFDNEYASLHSLKCPGYVARQPFPEIMPGASARIEVQRGVELRGRIASFGGPQADYFVTLYPKDRELIYVMRPAEATTDALGRFTITGLAPGTYELDFEPDGPPGERVREIVVDERPVQEVGIWVPSSGRVEIEVGPEYAGRWAAMDDGWRVAQVEPNGLAVIERASTGWHLLGIEDGSSDSPDLRETSVPIEVSADTTTKVRIDGERERPTPSIRVRVSGPNGGPVVGAMVSLAGEHGPITPSEWTPDPWDYDDVAITDARGRAQLRPYEGRFHVVAVRPGQFGVLLVDADADEQELEIRLQAIE